MLGNKQCDLQEKKHSLNDFKNFIIKTNRKIPCTARANVKEPDMLGEINCDSLRGKKKKKIKKDFQGHNSWLCESALWMGLA